MVIFHSYVSLPEGSLYQSDSFCKKVFYLFWDLLYRKSIKRIQLKEGKEDIMIQKKMLRSMDQPGVFVGSAVE